ncbi:MAG: hypothetical protein WBA10_02495 [Elainellaceae cyanobacterium]
MAKRRNLKKEKALRNEAYARKFRKRSNSRFGRRQYNQNRSGDGTNQDENDENSSNSSSSDSSTDNSAGPKKDG